MTTERIDYQVIEQNGKPVFAVVPFDDFQRLIHNEETTIPHQVVALSVEHDCGLVKAWRLHRNLTQAQVAERMEISQAAYQQLENSEGRYQHRTLEKLATALDVDPEQLTE